MAAVDTHTIMRAAHQLAREVGHLGGHHTWGVHAIKSLSLSSLSLLFSFLLSLSLNSLCFALVPHPDIVCLF